MRILYILRSEFGLIGTNASYMFPSIVNRTNKVRVISFDANKNENNLKVFEDPSVDIRQFPFLPIPRRTSTILRQIEYFNPDVVHQFYHGNCMFTAMMARAVESRPRKWLLDIRSPLFGEKDGVRRERRRNLYFQQYYNAILTHDPHSPKTVFPLIYKPVIQAPLAINSAAFHGGLQQVFPSKTIRCVFAGSLARRRKLDFLLEAFDLVRRKNLDVSLDIYGAGNDLNRLRDKSREMNLANVVNFKGLTSQIELIARLKEYQIGVCYIPQENFSSAPALKFYEYCAAGLFPLCSDNKGLRKAQRQGFTAKYFRNTPESFADALASLPSFEEQVNIRAANFEHSKQFTWENVVSKSLIPNYIKK